MPTDLSQAEQLLKQLKTRKEVRIQHQSSSIIPILNIYTHVYINTYVYVHVICLTLLNDYYNKNVNF